MQIQRNILLNPGPATTTDSVKLAQVVPDICPREFEFGELVDWIQKKLISFACGQTENGNASEASRENSTYDEYACVLMGGSGTAAIEMVISSVIPQQSALVVVNNGAYAARIIKIANIYNIPVVEFESPNHESINYDELSKCIVKAKEEYANKGIPITHLAAIHHETTSGLLNDAKRLGDLCKAHNLSLILDAMSSYGAMDIDMKRDNIEYLISSSNKNIQGMAGIGIIIANKKSLEQSSNIPIRSLYLNLYDQYAYFLKTKQFRFTPPVQTMYALQQAVKETLEEGVVNRHKRYLQSYRCLREGMEAMGFRVLVQDADSSGFITTFLDPQDSTYDFDAMHDFLIERGFTIYPGKVSQANTFRLANIGQIDSTDILALLEAIKDYLKINNITV